MAEIPPDALVDGRYKVLARLGSGGMADVFCAEDQQLGRKVALKLLHRRFAEDAEFVERFRREASAAAGLQHPNVVGVYDRGEWDGTYYIAMEYLPGRSLKDVIRQEAPLDPMRAIDITVQILKAARFAHRRGIVHRDLKPHNVMIDDEDRVKVTDFGIARAGASDMTETGSIMGTAQYLSPEQAQGHAVSQSSDLYAVGVILFELLTGHVPFDAESAVTIALKHVSEAPPAPSMFDPSVPPALEAIVLWALEKDPAARPADADAFIHALEDARDAVLASEAPGQRTAIFAPAAIPPIRTPRRRWRRRARRRGRPPPTRRRRTTPTRSPSRRAPPAAVVGVAARGARARGDRARHRAADAPGRRDGAARRRAGRRRRRRAELRAAGLETSVDRVTSGRAVDQVLAQDPAGGEQAKDGSTVTLTVSSGPGQVRGPAGRRARRAEGDGEADRRGARRRPRRAAGRRHGPGGPRDQDLAGGRARGRPRLERDAVRLQRPAAGGGAGRRRAHAGRTAQQTLGNAGFQFTVDARRAPTPPTRARCCARTRPPARRRRPARPWRSSSRERSRRSIVPGPARRRARRRRPTRSRPPAWSRAPRTAT